MLRRVVSLGGKALFALTIAALVLGQLFGQPILLSYVETGSMEPTLEAGDGFVAIPDAVAGDPEPGDVVVYEAESFDGGGLTTHRIVEETEDGYVTQGDANPFTDQDSDEPPVQDAQIVAHALEVGDQVVTIPHLGTAVMTVGGVLEGVQQRLAIALGTRSLLGTQGLAHLLLAVSMVAYVFETIRERSSGPDRDRSRSPSRDQGISVHNLSIAFALVVVIAATAAMVVPAGTQSFDVVTAEFSSENPLVVEQGTTSEVAYPVYNGGFVPIIASVTPASDGVDVAPQTVVVDSRSEAKVTATFEARDETGYAPEYVTERRYLYVLPRPVIAALHDVHPWVPIVAIDSLLGATVYGVGRIATPRGRVRRRERRSRDRA